ncbi:MAG: hypothetical protein LBQ66_00360 [Planctomycetaceae bacterium]|jgi:hypothetical protein|nr:hypothetical protein [Planctomycetaceae bacterium]
MILMGFEGNFYVGPVGLSTPNAVGMLLSESIREPKYGYEYSDVDATLRRHRGRKAHMKGLLDVEITFTLPNEKNDDGTRPADTALILESLRGRHTPITIIMLDEEGGEGLIGDFELFSGDKSEADDDVQAWEITARPSAAGRKVDWYPPDEDEE